MFLLQRFDQIGESRVILRNTGKVGFKFSTEKPQKNKTTVEQEKQDTMLEVEDEQNEESRPGQPKVIPATVS